MNDANRMPGNWIVLGDSISKGIVLDEARGRYASTKSAFMNLVAARAKASMKNFSLFGATVKKGLDVFKRQEKRLKKESIVFLEFGGNDCDFHWKEISADPTKAYLPRVPLEHFLEAYRQLIREIQARGMKTVLLSLPPLNSQRYFDTFSRGLNKENLMLWLGGSVEAIDRWHRSYNDCIERLARETGSFFIDIRKAFQGEEAKVRYLCQDGIHPNEEGHRCISEYILSRMGQWEARGELG